MTECAVAGRGTCRDYDVTVRFCDRYVDRRSLLVANAALSLLNLCCHLLDRQLAAQAPAYENEGGFTERLYWTRQRRRRKALA